MVAQSTVEDAQLLESVDLSSTLDLHRSNLLRMQVSELLEECQLDLDSKKWTIETQEYIQRISKIVSKVKVNEKDFRELADKPVSVSIHPSDQALSMEATGCTKNRLGFTKTSGNAQTLPTFEFLILIPDGIMTGKDYLNYRYFDKRTIILNSVAKTLSKQKQSIGIVEYIWTDGMNGPPLLRLEPPSIKKKARFQLYLRLGTKSMDWIPKLRLVPNRANIKEKGAKAQLYNHSLLHDIRHLYEDSAMNDLIEHKTCQEALILIKVWALQRGLWRNHDGWSESNVALLMVYLLRTNKMNARMTPLQQFTVVLQTWASVNWLGQIHKEEGNSRGAAGHDVQINMNARRKRTVLVLPEENNDESDTARSADLSQLYKKQTKQSPLSSNDPPTLIESYSWSDSYLLGPVFMDPSMSFNYLGKVSSNYMKLLSWYSQKALKDIKKSRVAFDILFMRRARFWQQWDLYLRVPVKAARDGTDWEFTVRNLVEKLEAGLGNRIYAMRVLSTGNGDSVEKHVDTDLFPRAQIADDTHSKKALNRSPIGANDFVVGVSINHETSQRVVDRGPPSDRQDDVKHFLELWGDKAELRRFKDGAIVNAVVWNDDDESTFNNVNKWGGGYVDKIIRHILKVHYSAKNVKTALPNLLSTIDGLSSVRSTQLFNSDSTLLHQSVRKAFESLSTFLRKKSEQVGADGSTTSSLGLPLSIDAVEALSPALRYSELFPPTPHTLLGYQAGGTNKVAGASSFEPILIQIRFGPSSKWPTDLKAIGAAKTALLLQLANGIEKSVNQDFGGLLTVCPAYADIAYKGYCFRIIVRADPEIQMLQRLSRPSADASRLLSELTSRHILTSRHHSALHAVHTLYPSAASVVRLARRWVSSHLLSNHLSMDLIELLVAKVYSDDSAFVQPPATVAAGFLRFLSLLSTFDWTREPLVVDPRGHIHEEEYDEIHHAFETSRSGSKDRGPPMYVIAPYNRSLYDSMDESDEIDSRTQSAHKWQPSITSPEWVVLNRLVHLANRSEVYLRKCLTSFDNSDWSAVFHESPSSFKSYSLLMRIQADLIVDVETSSTGGNLCESEDADGLVESSFTRSMKALAMGPKALRQKTYRNLRSDNNSIVIPAFHPVRDLVQELQRRFGQYAIFFYNDLCPEVIGVVWRPEVFKPTSFSAMSSERAYPVGDDWKTDTLVSKNIGDFLREMRQCSKDIVTSIRVFDDSCLAPFSKKQKIAEE